MGKDELLRLEELGVYAALRKKKRVARPNFGPGPILA
jgi:hypothetical protein